MVKITPARRKSLLGRQSYREMKQQALKAYGEVCSCCGEHRYQFLTFQHSNGDGAAHRRALVGDHRASGARFLRALSKRGFPPVEGLIVLCANCHGAEDLYGCCPHKLERWEREKHDRQHQVPEGADVQGPNGPEG